MVGILDFNPPGPLLITVRYNTCGYQNIIGSTLGFAKPEQVLLGEEPLGSELTPMENWVNILC